MRGASERGAGPSGSVQGGDGAAAFRPPNPHELMRVHEVLDILQVAQLVLHASLARKASSKPLCFSRSDYPCGGEENERRHIVIRQENGQILTREVPLDFFGDLKEEYEKRNQDYIKEAAEHGEN